MKKFTQNIGLSFLVALTLIVSFSSLSAASLVSDKNVSTKSTVINPSDYADSLKTVQVALNKADSLVKQLKGINYKDAGNKATIDAMFETSKVTVSNMAEIVDGTYNSDPGLIGRVSYLEVENTKFNKYLGLDSIITSSVSIAAIEAVERRVAKLKMQGTPAKVANAQRQIEVVIDTKLDKGGNVVNETVTLPYIVSRGLDDKPGSMNFFVLYKQLDGKMSLGEIEYLKGNTNATLAWKTGFKTVYNYLKFYNVCDDDLKAVKIYEKTGCTNQVNPVCRKYK